MNIATANLKELYDAVETVCMYCTRPADFEGTGEPCNHCWVRITRSYYSNLTNSDMYADEFPEGYDSCVCPVCNKELDCTSDNGKGVEDTDTYCLYQTCPHCGSEWTSYFDFNHLHIFKDGRFVKEV